MLPKTFFKIKIPPLIAFLNFILIMGISSGFSEKLIGLESKETLRVDLLNSDLYYEESAIFFKINPYLSLQGTSLSRPNHNSWESIIQWGILPHSIFYRYDYLINALNQDYLQLSSHQFGYRYLINSADKIPPNEFILSLDNDYLKLNFSNDINPIHFGFELDFGLNDIYTYQFLDHYSYFMGYSQKIFAEVLDDYYYYVESRFHFKQIQIDLKLKLIFEFFSIESIYTPENQNRISEWVLIFGFGF